MADVKKITLAGVEYFIPALPIKVVRQVVPLATRLAKLRFAPDEIAEDDINGLIKIVFLGIQFGKPDFKMDDLENMVIPFNEIQEAAQVILVQSGMMPAAAGKPQAE
jgi:hypothetical protein